MGKNIVFCADGTWNNPYEDENSDSCADPTNVYKLFLCLAGTPSADSLRSADEQEKEYLKDGVIQQIAKYIHGVGDSHNPINRIIGGAFGAGVISRIVRGYTFISRNYEPGDKVFIIGFSRGAYTARALGGLVASQGLLSPKNTTDKEQAYRLGAKAWYRYRKTVPNSSILAHIFEIAADLPAFVSNDFLQASDFVEVDSIASIAVWDTVGAMGYPSHSGGKLVDAFKFADTKLSQKVKNGFHAVAVDEQREMFTPTLWDIAPNVTQVLFPGAHADVGGGYPVTNNESGLSDGALNWMVNCLTGVGVDFSDSPQLTINPSSVGTAHKPWLHNPWPLHCFPKKVRNFAGFEINQDSSIAERMAVGNVAAEPGTLPEPYDPINLP